MVVEGQDGPLVCVDDDGWRWEPTSSLATNSSGSGSSVVTASSGSLAFTGTGPGLRLLLMVGAGFIALGLSALVLADAPRRAIGWIGNLAAGREGERLGSPASELPAAAGLVSKTPLHHKIERLVFWLLGRE